MKLTKVTCFSENETSENYSVSHYVTKPPSYTSFTDPTTLRLTHQLEGRSTELFAISGGLNSNEMSTFTPPNARVVYEQVSATHKKHLGIYRSFEPKIRNSSWSYDQHYQFNTPLLQTLTAHMFFVSYDHFKRESQNSLMPIYTYLSMLSLFTLLGVRIILN